MRARTIAFTVILILLSTALLSCAITAGSTFASVIEAEATGDRNDRAEPGDEEHADNESREEENYVLAVRSSPSDAEVWIDNSSYGSTPLLVDDLEPGRYRLRVEKSGYYTAGRWIEISEDERLVIELDLAQITGYLQVSSSPRDTEISVAGSSLDSGFAELPIGTHVVRVRRFGYREIVRTVEVIENRTTYLDVRLEPLSFSVSQLRVSRNRFNPANPGRTGAVRISFRVTAPGKGAVTVYGPDGEIVDTVQLDRFTTWEQSFTWPSTRPAHELEDGPYELQIELKGNDGREIVDSRSVVVDSSIVVRHRSIWSSSPGLLYAPVPSPLPAGIFQVSVAGAGVSTVIDDMPINRFPVKLGLRVGLGNDIEAMASASVIAHSAPVYDRWAAGGSVSWSPDAIQFGPATFGTAIIAGGAYRNADLEKLYTGPDTLTDFPGVFLLIPALVTVRPLTVSLAAEYHLSPAPVTYGSETADNQATHYLYGRGGVLLETGPAAAGVSFALRGLPYPALVTLDPPIHAAGELHWTVGSVVVSAFFAGEFDSGRDFYIMGGAGFSVLF